jgi:hypothetical protein
MHPDAMKHKASLWEGDFGTSRHITDVCWEGDITQDQLMDVADQITLEWQTIDLELDAAHPCHGQTYRLQKVWPDTSDARSPEEVLQAEGELCDKYVWVHCCKHVYDPAGELEDDDGRAFRQVFDTVMFCVPFTSFEDIALLCDENLGEGEWDSYELYLDDELPPPIAYYA